MGTIAVTTPDENGKIDVLVETSSDADKQLRKAFRHKATVIDKGVKYVVLDIETVQRFRLVPGRGNKFGKTQILLRSEGGEK